MKNANNIFKLTLLFTIVTTTSAYAYSDPGTGLMLLQLLCSAVVGVLFYFKKIRNLILNAFNLKTNDK
jgi:hypothetical protein